MVGAISCEVFVLLYAVERDVVSRRIGSAVLGLRLAALLILAIILLPSPDVVTDLLISVPLLLILGPKLFLVLIVLILFALGVVWVISRKKIKKIKACR